MEDSAVFFFAVDDFAAEEEPFFAVDFFVVADFLEEDFSTDTYQSFDVGSLPVMELFTAGLKVGEVMARARISGMNVIEAAKYSLNNSPAMDFEGDLAWLKD